MRSFPILVDLGLVVAAAAVMLLLGRMLRLPPILSYLLAGLALGPATGLLEGQASMELFSGPGVARLLFIVGLAVTFSSTVVVVKLLERAGAVAADWGRIAIGVLIVQDVAVAIALTVLHRGGGSAGESAGAALAVGAGRAALGMAALAAAA